MNSKQRILTALNNAQPDKVPVFEARIDEPIMFDLARTLGVNVRQPGTGKAENYLAMIEAAHKYGVVTP